MNELTWFFRQQIFPAAFSLLPGGMNTKEARAMLFAIGLQESLFKYRRQLNQGPARGFWQFERGGGVAEILESLDTKDWAVQICQLLAVRSTRAEVHVALEQNDVLATCFARLLLYRDPRPLPTRIDIDLGWSIYIRNWRPGKPRLKDWPENFEQAWKIVEGEMP